MKQTVKRTSPSRAGGRAGGRAGANVPALLKLLRGLYPSPRTALHFQTPIQMLVATILSAQCTDVRVNKVTPALFAKYPTVQDFASAKIPELEKLIHSTGFYKNKAKNILGAATMIVKKFHGKVPRTMPEMLELPGVARKTANVVLHNCYGIIEGVVVDTHVGRLSRRLGLTKHTDAGKVEKDLMELLPHKDWADFPNMLIEHGRAVCKSARPDCSRCVLQKICPSAFAFNTKGKWIGVK